MYLNKNYTDWVDIVTRNGSQQNHFINISGNTKNITYRVGLGYQNEEGIMYDGYERFQIKSQPDSPQIWQQHPKRVVATTLFWKGSV